MMISQYHITAGTQHLGASPNLTPKEKKEKVMQSIKAWVDRRRTRAEHYQGPHLSVPGGGVEIDNAA